MNRMQVLVVLVTVAGFAGSGVAQQGAEERSQPGRLEAQPDARKVKLKEVVIQGGKVTLKRGYSFGRIVDGKMEVLDAAGQRAIGLSCMCSGGNGGGCRLVDSGGGVINCINDTCRKGRCGAAVVPPPASSHLDRRIHDRTVGSNERACNSYTVSPCVSAFCP